MKLQNYLTLKNKIQNHFMNSGLKSISEKTILKSFKVLQKNKKKNHKDLLKFIVINKVPVIHLKQIKKKNRKTVKEFPFVLNENNRITFSIKSILKSINQKKQFNVSIRLFLEILNIISNKTEIVKTNEKNQDYALTKKKYTFFRWFC